MSSPAQEADVRFYSIANSAYFIGLVGLINSIRASGHVDPILVLDTGLTREQRELIGEHVEMIEGPGDVPALFLKDIGMRARPAEVMIYLDADVLVLRRLDPFVADAARGTIVVFEDRLAEFENDRTGLWPPIYDAWMNRLRLQELIPRPYANAGMMILPRDMGLALLAELRDAQGLIDNDETFVGSTDLPRPSDPFYFGDQDLMNAFLSLPRYFRATHTLPHSNASSPPYNGLAAAEHGLSCTTESPDVEPPFLLHQIQSKPWLKRMRTDVYYELLVRAINHPGGPVRLDRDSIPAFLRSGPEGEVARRRRALVARLEARARGRLKIRGWLSDERRRRAIRAGGYRSDRHPVDGP